MQAGYIHLTPVVRGDGHGGTKGGEITDWWVNVAHVIEVGVIDGVTFVATPLGCTRVQEPPLAVLDKLSDVVAKLNGDWGDDA